MRTALWCLALSIAFTGALAFTLVQNAERGVTFSEYQRTWLVFNRPGGHFVGDTTYRFCDQRGGGFWVDFRANGDFVPSARPCWLWLLPHSLD